MQEKEEKLSDVGYGHQLDIYGDIDDGKFGDDAGQVLLYLHKRY